MPWNAASNLWTDFRFAYRRLWESPGVTVAVIVSLALGLGANATIFSALDDLFLRPLPLREAENLVSVYGTDEKNAGAGGLTHFPVSYPNFEDLRDHNNVFSGVFAQSFLRVSLLRGRIPEQVDGQIVSGSYFDVLGVESGVGRTFHAEDDRVPGQSPVVVLSHGFWQRGFGGDPHVAGFVVRINGHPFTIVGVAPRGFKGTDALAPPDFWVPMMMHGQVFPYDAEFDGRRWRMFQVFGRLRAGVGARQANAAMTGLAQRLEEAYPADNRGRGLRVMSLRQAVVNPDQRPMLVRVGALLMTGAGLVLLIACLNIAGLLLTRAVYRQSEIAVRIALGARRAQLVRQMLAESVVLAIPGGLVALLVAHWSLRGLWSLRPPSLSEEVVSHALAPRVAVFAVILAVAASVLFGLGPALVLSRQSSAVVLRQGAAPLAGGQRTFGLRGWLVAAQIALSLVALVSAGLFFGSLRNMQRIDPGFETAPVLVTSFDLKAQGYDEGRGRGFYDRLLAEVAILPGVRAASLAESPPLFPWGTLRSVSFPDQEVSAAREGVLIGTNTVHRGYFETLGIPLEHGRAFDEGDRQGGRRVCIVNRRLAERFWPGLDPLGRQIRLADAEARLVVVGVVRDARYRSLNEEIQPYLYLPAAQWYTPGMSLQVRADGDPARVAGPVRDVVCALDRTLPMSPLRTVAEIVDGTLWAQRTAVALLATFGLLGMALAALGVYGTVSFNLGQRRREVAIRIALGEQRGSILLRLLRQGLLLVTVGLALGLAATLALERLFEGLLYGIRPTDLATLTGTSLLLGMAALFGGYLPARRISRLAPAPALSP